MNKMTPYLSKPNTKKESTFSANQSFCVGSSRMQGWRNTMEDRHTQFLSLPQDSDATFLAVYDGHGGTLVSQYLANNLHNCIVNRYEYLYKRDIKMALKSGMLEIDQKMRMYGVRPEGSTAVVVLVKDNRLYCANVGDSRAIFCVNGLAGTLSIDHKPSVDAERERIYAAGGYLARGRVMGNLAMTRAFGDFAYKKNAAIGAENQIITAIPDVKICEIDEAWEFVVLASDGIWNVMSTKQVVDFCREHIVMGMMPDKICEDLMDKCLSTDNPSRRASRDNMTVVLLCFLHNKPYEALVKRCGSCVGFQAHDEATPSTSTSAIAITAESQNENSPQEENVGTVAVPEITENLGNPENSEMTENLENPENSEMTENLENPENSEMIGNLENPEDSEMIENLENPENSEMTENLENPENSEITENLENPENSEMMKAATKDISQDDDIRDDNDAN